MKRHGIFRWFQSDHKLKQKHGSSKCMIFRGNNKNFIKNGETLLEERISLFDGRTNPIRCFTVDDLNSMDVDNNRMIERSSIHHSNAGVWNGKLVLVKIFHDARLAEKLVLVKIFHDDGLAERISKLACREVAVATQMGTQRNVHRLLGCCLDTKYPVLVYQWAENGNVHDRILSYKEESKEPLEWKDRLRIAWEIAHTVAYLHTAFRRPIIHRDLKPFNVLLDQDDSARLSDFSLSISIPEGETHAEDAVVGTWGYVAPDYMISGKVAESSDVFSFGTLLLVFLTGKSAVTIHDGGYKLVKWVSECRAANCLDDVVDPTITRNGAVVHEHFERQLKALVELAIRCSAEDEECRPTMVEVATQIENMIMSSSDTL